MGDRRRPFASSVRPDFPDQLRKGEQHVIYIILQLIALRMLVLTAVLPPEWTTEARAASGAGDQAESHERVPH